MRDAQSLLDQLLAFGGERLTVEQVHQMLGTAADERIIALAEGVLSGDLKRALDLLDEAATTGLQLGELVEQLIAYWRDLMILRAGGEGRDLSVPARHRETLTRQANALSLDTILAGLDVLSSTKARLRGSNYGRTLVEMALVRLGRLKDLVSLTQLSQWLTQPRADGAGPVPARVAPPEGVKKKPLTGSLETQGDGAPAELTQDTLPMIWGQVLKSVGTILASEMKNAGNPAISGPNTLVLRFPSVYNRASEYCQDPARLARMEEALRKTTGRSWTLRVETSPTVAPAAPSAGEAEPAVPVRPRRDHRGEAEKLPLVKRAMEVLGAKILQVEEGFGASAEESSRRADRVPDEEG
jgi:DNA polymerase-3 subunit gamma/tau